MSAVFNHVDDAIRTLEVLAEAHVEDKDNPYRERLSAKMYDVYKELFKHEYIDLAKRGIMEEWDKHKKPSDSWDATRWLHDEHKYYVMAAEIVCVSKLWEVLGVNCIQLGSGKIDALPSARKEADK